MASGPYGAVLQQIHRLFRQGSVGGLSEWQLLDRYVTHHDESAFEALVARHGPMVLGVCRRLLDDPHAVEDAFQATFLVLVRKARSLGERDAIGHWLYGVACRVALHARSEAARRKVLEKPMVSENAVSANSDPSQFEIAALLDDELSRLPAKYRAPVVLCYLEGLTHEEAAHQLQWPVGTVKGRLARARDLLRGRLARRGLTPTAGLLAATLARDAAAAVPESLIQTTVQAASRVLAGGTTGVVVSATVTRLMEGVLSTMFATKVKIGAAILGACGGLALGAWALAQPSRGERRGPTAARAEAKAETAPGVAVRDRAIRDKLEEPVTMSFPNETPLEDVLKYIKAATQGPNDSGVPIYVDPDGLKEAGATVHSTVTIDVKDRPLRESLDAMLRPLKLGATTRGGLLVVSSRPEIALIELRKLNERLAPRTEPSKAPDGADRTERPNPAHWLKQIEEREVTPEARAKNQAILDALEKRVPMPFANETPLEDVLKYIKSETASKDLPSGLPIYVDPVGLQEVEKTMTSPVTIDVEGVPIKTTLRLILKQLGLAYSVKGGLLSITSESSVDLPAPILELSERATRGELTFDEMKELVELFRVRAEVFRYAKGEGLDTPPTAAPAAPAAPAAKPANPAPSKPTQAPPDDLDAERTKAILDALNKVVPLSFKGTPIEQAIEEVRKATVGPEFPEGVPIYFDLPTYQNQPNVPAPARTVTLELKGVRLRTSLRLMLRQLGLVYNVKEGLLIIGPEGTEEVSTGGMYSGGMMMGAPGGGFR
jgi:RNA polymerase sigma factor (sigma-70 family)